MHKVTARQKPGRLRIIGGEWRGRKLDVPSVPGLRPTADRIRETLFNWLREQTPGARCLDLFAGSGALGLEALSRGAAHCHFVDRSRVATEAIKHHLDTLGGGARGRVCCGDALQWHGPPADLVFLDPPFADDLLDPAIQHLEVAGLLSHGARIYIELERRQALPALAASMEVLRDKTAGEVRYLLIGYQNQGLSGANAACTFSASGEEN